MSFTYSGPGEEPVEAVDIDAALAAAGANLALAWHLLHDPAWQVGWGAFFCLLPSPASTATAPAATCNPHAALQPAPHI